MSKIAKIQKLMTQREESGNENSVLHHEAEGNPKSTFARCTKLGGIHKKQDAKPAVEKQSKIPPLLLKILLDNYPSTDSEVLASCREQARYVLLGDDTSEWKPTLRRVCFQKTNL